MNNKGMAITTVIYSIILLLSLCMFLVLGILRSEYTNDKQYILDLREELNNLLKGDEESYGVDKIIKQTGNKDNSGLYTITHSKDTTLQIGNDKDIKEYRYRGANPKNYVTFNNEVWRIIGVFPVDDGNGNIENRIKLIRNESIGDKFWDGSVSNNWARPAKINSELNTTYLNSLDSTSKSMIGQAKYYLGGKNVTWNNGYADTSLQFYSYERKISGSEYYYNGSYPNSWTGKLALMYASDYGYASSNCENKPIYDKNSSSNDIRACNTTNWLLFKSNTEWILPQYASRSDVAFDIFSDGYVYNDLVSARQYGVRPVLYLISSAQITGGNGTSTNPYTFGL